MVNRNLGFKMSNNEIKKLKPEDAQELFDCSNLAFMAHNSIAAKEFLKKIILDIEKKVKSQVKVREEFLKLLTIPGIGNILGLTIMLEVGDIGRFPQVSDYSSYCRCVESKRVSNGKKKGENNKKNGNKYLAWAFMEAAHHAAIWSPEIKRFYQKRKARKHILVARKTVANKLAKACYHMLMRQEPFDVTRAFG